MKARIRHVQCNIEDKPYYLALEIDGVIFKMSAESYKSMNKESMNKADEFIDSIADRINSVEKLEKGFCSYLSRGECNQQ